MARSGLYRAGIVGLTLGACGLALNAGIWIYDSFTCDNSSAWGGSWCHIGSAVVWLFMGRWAAALTLGGLVLVGLGWRDRAAARG